MSDQTTRRRRKSVTRRRRRGSIDLAPWASGTIRDAPLSRSLFGDGTLHGPLSRNVLDALGDSGIRLVTREPVTRWRRISQRRFNKILRNVGKTPRRRYPNE